MNDSVLDESRTLFDQALANGDWASAVELGIVHLQERLAHGIGFTTTDYVMIERVADLAALVGKQEAADQIYAGAAGLQRDNRFAADYLQLKRAYLTASEGMVDRTPAVLQELSIDVGDFVRGAENLGEVESRCQWRRDPKSFPDADALFARLYLCLGLHSARLGQYGLSEDLLDRGLEQVSTSRSNLAQIARVPLLIAKGRSLLERGDFDAASELLVKELSGSFIRENVSWNVNTLEIAAKIDLLRGRYGAAEQQLHSVYELCSEAGFRKPTIASLINQAEVLILLNRTSVAESLLAVARQLAEDAGEEKLCAHLGTLQTLAEARRQTLRSGERVLTAVEMQRSQASDGHQSDGQSVEAAVPQPDSSDAPSYLSEFEQRAFEIQWLLHASEFDAATSSLEQLREDFHATDSELIRLKLNALLGQVAYHLGRIEVASDVLQRAKAGLEQLGLIPDLWSTCRYLLWCADLRGASNTELTPLARECDDHLRVLSDSLPAASRAIFLLNKWTDEEQFLSRRLDHLAAASRAATSAVWPLRRLRERRFKHQSIEFLNLLEENKRDIAVRETSMHIDEGNQSERAVRQPRRRRTIKLDRETALISALVLPDQVAYLINHRARAEMLIVPITRLRVRELVAHWHSVMSLGADLKVVSQAAQEIVSELHLDDVFRRLQTGVRHVLFSADDSLHGLPLAAMRWQQRWLVETYSITCVGALDRVGGSPRQASGARALGVGVAHGAGKIPPLPHVKQEVGYLCQWAKQRGYHVCELLDEQADRARVLRELKDASLVHFACHGVFKPDDVSASGLVMLPNDNAEIISSKEIASLELGHVRHVTLSCCWGADSFVLPGRWIVSLPEVFCRVGAESVLACLWAVDDEVGHAFSNAFYDNLGHMSRRDALAQTQRQCLENRLPLNTDTTHPSLWAGYQIYGNGGRL